MSWSSLVRFASMFWLLLPQFTTRTGGTDSLILTSTPPRIEKPLRITRGESRSTDNLQTSKDCTGGDFRHGMDKVSVAQINVVAAQQVAGFDGSWDGELFSVVVWNRDEQHSPRRLLRLEGPFEHAGGRVLEVPRTSDIVAILRICSIVTRATCRWCWRGTRDGKARCCGCARVTDRFDYRNHNRAVIAA